ncbi:MAG: NYN domain-containing protein [Patescibacteria group bacterium]
MSVALKFKEFQKESKRAQYGIGHEFGLILSLIDFGNVDYWYEFDNFNRDGKALKDNEKLNVDLEYLKQFCDLFSYNSKFYFGLDSKKKESIHLIASARNFFGKTNVVTKEIQYIQHYLNDLEKKENTRSVTYDIHGQYIKIPKCNFDVEICIDAIRLADKYDTLCLFSGDADFTALLRFLKYQKKKIILIKGGRVLHSLVKASDLVINAQEIKNELVFIKQKSRR